MLGRHVILGLAVPIKGLFAVAALHLHRPAAVLAFDVSIETGFSEFFVARHAEVRIPGLFLFVVHFHEG